MKKKLSSFFGGRGGSGDSVQLVNFWNVKPVLFDSLLPQFMAKTKKLDALREVPERINIPLDLVMKR